MTIVDTGDILLEVLDEMGINGLNALKEEERTLLLSSLEEFSTSGTSELFDNLVKADYKMIPVSPREFFGNEYYMGTHGQSLYESWLNELEYVLDPKNDIREWIASGSIGSGKSTAAVAAKCYKIYHMLCLSNLHDYYGLMQNSLVVMMFFGLTLEKADLTLWNKFESFITGSPFFRDIGFIKEKSDDSLGIEFPNHIKVMVGSSAKHAMSYDLCGGILDEQEFRKTKHGTSYGAGSNPYDLYRAVWRRMRSRFPRMCPGILINVSSSGTLSGYMSQHINEVSTDPHSYVSSFSRYEVDPSKFGEEQFRVEVGDDEYESRILEEDEAPRPGARIEYIPMEYYLDFKRNPDEALQDISGITTRGGSKLIRDRQSIWNCVNKDRESPFKKDSITSGIVSNIPDVVEFIIPEKVSSKENSLVKGKFVPLVNPRVPRYVHLDLAETDDAAGLLVGHLNGFKLLDVFDPDIGSYVSMKHPIIYVDMALEINPARGDKIDFASITAFLLYLKNDLGFKFKSLTTDTWGSNQIRQTFDKAGVKTGILSVDRTDIPYVETRNALSYVCIDMYPCKPLTDNLVDVEHDIEKHSVDHTDSGSKDVSDCLAAVVHKILVDHPMDTVLTDEERERLVAGSLDLVNLRKDEPDQIINSFPVKGTSYKHKRDPGDFFD